MMKKKQLGDFPESREDKFMLPGIDFKAKLIGIEPVADARGDKMCLDAMIKLKYLMKSIGGHKPRIVINVSIEGIRILDEKTREVLHQHEVHRISFISRDPTDPRAFGYVYGEHGNHKFYGIKTEKQADALVLTLKDLFEVVLHLKKEQIAEQKKVEQITGPNTAPTSQNPIHASFKNPPPAENDVQQNGQENGVDSEPMYAQVNKPKLSELAAGLSDQSAGNAGGLLDLEQDIKNLQMGLDTMEEFDLNPDTPTSPQPNQFAMPPPASDPFGLAGPPPTQQGSAFGSSDPFAVQATPTAATNSAPPPTSTAPSADLFREFKDTFTGPAIPTQTPVNAFQAPMTQSAAPNPFGQPAPAAPFQANFGNAFGGGVGMAPGGFGAPPPSNAFGAPPPSNAFGAPPPSNAFGGAPMVQPAADPFGGELSFGDNVLKPDSTPNQLGSPPPQASDPFSEFGALSSAKTEAPKSVKDMFSNYRIGKPGEPAPAPEIKLTGGPRRPPPAIPTNAAPASTLIWP